MVSVVSELLSSDDFLHGDLLLLAGGEPRQVHPRVDGVGAGRLPGRRRVAGVQAGRRHGQAVGGELVADGGNGAGGGAQLVHAVGGGGSGCCGRSCRGLLHSLPIGVVAVVVTFPIG